MQTKFTTTRPQVQRTRIITMECPICEKDTPHALNWGMTAYVCGFCANEMIYHENKAKPMLAMDTRESPDAQARFEEWIGEL